MVGCFQSVGVVMVVDRIVCVCVRVCVCSGLPLSKVLHLIVE